MYLEKLIKIYVSARLSDDEISINESIQITNNLISHIKKIADYINVGLNLFAIIFFIWFRLNKFFFNKKTSSNIINKARLSSFFIFKDTIRFLDSLYEIAMSSEIFDRPEMISFFKNDSFYDFIVVGSGPGGAISAKRLKENGFLVCLIDKGGNDTDFNIKPYSYYEMKYKYTNGGVNSTIGNCKITFVEGQCFGGGSEVNSGLYHRPSDEILNDWKKNYKLENTDINRLVKFCKTIEDKLQISFFPKNTIPRASLMLEKGAKALNWECQEIPRWFKYQDKTSANGKRMSMTATFLKEYISLGGQYLLNTEVLNFKKNKNLYEIKVLSNNQKKMLFSKNIILSAGTIGSAFLLKKSKFSKLAGKSFQMHPTIKIVALFDEVVNNKKMGVPVHQVKEFSPDISFGCSISSKPYLKIAMLDHPAELNLVDKKWKKMAIYYAMIKPEGSGSIKKIPGFKSPFITYYLTKKDKINLAKGLKNLSKLLLKSGAIELFPSVNNSESLKCENDIDKLPDSINSRKTSLMTVHLFSSCPSGEDKKKVCC